MPFDQAEACQRRQAATRITRLEMCKLSTPVKVLLGIDWACVSTVLKSEAEVEGRDGVQVVSDEAKVVALGILLAMQVSQIVELQATGPRRVRHETVEVDWRPVGGVGA